jgi:capsule polysaccharide export protein KpsE/RkpR
MDVKDINIKNLQMENIRLRNLLAGRDALVKSIEQDKEEWTKEARVGYISLEEHFAEMDNLLKENDLEKFQLRSELKEERKLRLEAEAKIHELEEAVAKSEEAHKEELAKFNTEYIHAALSLEKKLVVMLYKEGSRSHEIPEEKSSSFRVQDSGLSEHA